MAHLRGACPQCLAPHDRNPLIEVATQHPVLRSGVIFHLPSDWFRHPTLLRKGRGSPKDRPFRRPPNPGASRPKSGRRAPAPQPSASCPPHCLKKKATPRFWHCRANPSPIPLESAEHPARFRRQRSPSRSRLGQGSEQVRASARPTGSVPQPAPRRRWSARKE